MNFISILFILLKIINNNYVFEYSTFTIQNYFFNFIHLNFYPFPISDFICVIFNTHHASYDYNKIFAKNSI